MQANGAKLHLANQWEAVSGAVAYFWSALPQKRSCASPHLHCTSSATKGECTWKTASSLIHFGWPQKKKNLKFPVVLEAGSKRLSRTQSFRYYETLRKPPYTEWTLWRSYDEHVKPPQQNIDPQMNRSATKGEVPNQWRKNIRCYPFFWGIIDLAPFSLHCQRLWKTLRQNIWPVFTFGASRLLSLEKQQLVFVLDVCRVAALLVWEGDHCHWQPRHDHILSNQPTNHNRPKWQPLHSRQWKRLRVQTKIFCSTIKCDLRVWKLGDNWQM